MKQSQYGGSESLSVEYCDLFCVSNSGDTTQWIKTKIVTYLDS